MSKLYYGNLVVYLNPGFVNEIYETIVGGKVETATSETQEGSKNTVSASGKADGGVDLKFVGKLNASGGLEGSHEGDKSNKFAQTITYSNSYRLNIVRQKLIDDKQVLTLSKTSDFEMLGEKEFVEFSANFSKNEFIEVLETITPEMAATIAYGMYADSVKKKLTEGQKLGDFFEEKEKDFWVSLASEMIRSLKKEFGNETTAEFYGQLEDSKSNPLDISTVTICDKGFFSSGDEDRILDGTYKVLGKVIAIQKEGSKAEITKFDRNKLLKRIKPIGREWLEKKIEQRDEEVEKYFDTKLELTIKGKAFKIIPIAIYA